MKMKQKKEDWMKEERDKGGRDKPVRYGWAFGF